MLTIYISNLSEDVWPFICSLSNEEARRAEIEDNLNTADRDLFALIGLDNLICVLPIPVSRAFLDYYQSLCPAKKVEVLAPARHSGCVCDDILEDRALFDALACRAREAEQARLISYCWSAQLACLIEELKRSGVRLFTPEAPRAGCEWTVNSFGSKAGIRELVSRINRPDGAVSMPEGFMASGLEEIAARALELYRDKGGAVIKTNKGHAGAGVIILRAGDLPLDASLARADLMRCLSAEKYWRDFPAVIEDYVDLDASCSGGSPSIEYRIDEQGTAHCLYPCAMRVSREGVFQGVEISAEALPPKVNSEMRRIGDVVAKAYSESGYRGYFDIDFMLARDGRLFLGESNVRRTGGTHAYHLAAYFLGPDFSRDYYVIANNCFALDKSRVAAWSFENLLETLEPIAFRAATKEGVIITSEHKLSQRQLGFVIIGRSRERAYSIEREMLDLLKIAG